MGKRLISALAGKGTPPPGWDANRWKKLGENTRRAERLTGVAPLAADGWEMVAVILMDLLEEKRSRSKRKAVPNGSA